MTGLFIDISNIYYLIYRKYDKRKLDYKKILKEIEPKASYAYGCQDNDEASSFIYYLKRLGFKVRYKKPYILKIGNREIKRCNWSAGVAVDVLSELISIIDFAEEGINFKDNRIIVISSNPDLIPLYKELRSRGITIEVWSVNVPNSVRKHVNKVIELDETWLEEI